MKNTIAQHLKNVNDPTSRLALQKIINPIADRMSSFLTASAVLAIKAGASALVKADEVIYAFAAGTPVTKVADTDMAALAGTVVNATFNVFCFYIDNAGTLTSAMGTAGATYTAVKFPTVPVGKAMIGYVIINPTGTGNFVGGTTALDDATVVPTAVYVNTVGAFDPTILTGATVNS